VAPLLCSPEPPLRNCLRKLPAALEDPAVPAGLVPRLRPRDPPGLERRFDPRDPPPRPGPMDPEGPLGLLNPDFPADPVDP
jgi:hypothetical protein